MVFEVIGEELVRGVVLERPAMGKQVGWGRFLLWGWFCLGTNKAQRGAGAARHGQAGAARRSCSLSTGCLVCTGAGPAAVHTASLMSRALTLNPLLAPLLHLSYVQYGATSAGQLLCMLRPSRATYSPHYARHSPAPLQYGATSGLLEYTPAGVSQPEVPGLPPGLVPAPARLPFMQQDVQQGSGSLRPGDHVTFRIATNLQVIVASWHAEWLSVLMLLLLHGGRWSLARRRDACWAAACPPAHPTPLPTSHPSTPQAAKAAALATVPGAAQYAGKRAVEVAMVRYAGVVAQVRAISGGCAGCVRLALHRSRLCSSCLCTSAGDGDCSG